MFLLKAAETNQAQTAKALLADIRWCLTGTPIQNKLEDLQSLFSFLRYYPFSHKVCR